MERLDGESTGVQNSIPGAVFRQCGGCTIGAVTEWRDVICAGCTESESGGVTGTAPVTHQTIYAEVRDIQN